MKDDKYLIKRLNLENVKLILNYKVTIFLFREIERK
jgi:hypothetical protein